MRNIFIIFCAMIYLSSCSALNNSSKYVRKKVGYFVRGIRGPVYRTDGPLNVMDVTTNSQKVISTSNGDIIYRVVDREDGKVYIKIFPYTKFAAAPVPPVPVPVPPVPVPPVSIEYTEIQPNNDQDASKHLYYFNESEAKGYNKVLLNGITLGTAVLPIKMRPSTTVNNTRYERIFSTDIAIGPFLGYRIKLGKYYKQFTTIGMFAGPSLINLTTTTQSSTPGQITSNNDNLFGFSYGTGITFHIDDFQVGIISGRDYLGGERAKDWIYDKKNWYSFAIGFNFFNDR